MAHQNTISLCDMKECFPIETAEYAISHGLQHEAAFAWWLPTVLQKRDRYLKKVKTKYWERTHKYGVKIPHSIKQAIKIDTENGNTLWQDSTGEVSKLVGYKKITG